MNPKKFPLRAVAGFALTVAFALGRRSGTVPDQQAGEWAARQAGQALLTFENMFGEVPKTINIEDK